MNKEVIIEKIKYYSTQTFLKHVLIALAIVLGIALFTMASLNIYTDHGDEYIVPDLNGLSLKQAGELLDDNDLQYEISDSVYYIDRPRGSVVEQNPPADFKVKKGRTIFITINARQMQMVEIPNVTNVSLTQAKSDLETEGLWVGNLNYVPDIAVNYVLMQSFKGKKIAPGTKLPKGSFIDLTIGKGLEDQDFTIVPNLKNLKKKEALSKAVDFYLNIGSISYDKSVKTLNDSLNAKVWKQSPENSRSNSVKMGSTVNLWFTVDKKKLAN